MRSRLREKVAIITGGSRGIGAATARAFARHGARVVIASRKQEALDAVADEINDELPGTVTPIACHVGDEDAIAELVEHVHTSIGLPNVLVNNAATNPYFGPLLDTPMGAWDKTFEVNLKGCFVPAQHVARRLIDAGREGSIINVSSILGLRAAPLQGVYGMTKAALISMTKTLAYELGSTGIRVNAVAPGLVDTRLASALIQSDDLLAPFLERTPLDRYAQPEEIADLLVFLASDESKFVTGQTYPIDGGFLAF